MYDNHTYSVPDIIVSARQPFIRPIVRGKPVEFGAKLDISVRYSDYEYKEKGGTLYLLPTENAAPSVYDPMTDAEALVLKAMEIGLMCFNRNTPDKKIKSAIREFACQYGLLGLMTALPESFLCQA